jgi:hypothetical protein
MKQAAKRWRSPFQARSFAGLGASVAVACGVLGAGGCSSCGNSSEPNAPDTAVESAPGVDAASPEVERPDVVDASVVLCPKPRHGTSALHGRVFGATTVGASAVFEVTNLDGGTAGPPFATGPAGQGLSAMLLTPEGKLYIAAGENGGTVWEISAGGDFSAATPVASKVFTQDGTTELPAAMAMDDKGSLYLTNSDKGPKQIAKITLSGATGTSTLLPIPLDNATGIVACTGVLLIAEGATGRVVRRDLATGAQTDFATGFYGRADHVSAMLVVDERGRLLVNWRASGGDGGTPSKQGIFDITGGGDFSTATPLVVIDTYIDLNQLAVSQNNDLFMAGAVERRVFVAPAQGNGWAPFTTFADGLGDTESVGIGP